MSKSSGRRELGWWSAGMLILILSSPAWALDLDKSIQAQNSETIQIASKLGRTHQVEPAKPEAGPNKDKTEMRVVLIRKPTHNRRHG